MTNFIVYKFNSLYQNNLIKKFWIEAVQEVIETSYCTTRFPKKSLAFALMKQVDEPNTKMFFFKDSDNFSVLSGLYYHFL